MSSGQPLPSLRELLRKEELESYYDSFIQAGARENDLPQLLSFNDQELGELLAAVRMLPFHAVRLKRALRTLRESSENTVSVPDLVNFRSPRY